MNSAEQPKADVSVVIPTALRPTLPRAVRSVLAQTVPPAQVLVVLDSRAARQRSSDQEAVLAAVEALPGVSVLVDADAAPGANSARNRGVAAARHRWLALLDDDDRWRPQRLATQLPVLTALNDPRAIGYSRVEMIFTSSGATAVAPRLLPRPRQSIADYLLTRRHLRPGEALLHPSSLLMNREMAASVAWREDLERHQDWDWLLDLEQRGCHAVVMPEVLVDVDVSTTSVSTSGAWISSERWLHERTELRPRQRGDALLTVTAELARRSAGRGAALSVVRRALSTSRPGPAALGFAASQLLLPSLGHRARLLADRLQGRPQDVRR